MTLDVGFIVDTHKLIREQIESRNYEIEENPIYEIELKKQEKEWDEASIKTRMYVHSKIKRNFQDIRNTNKAKFQLETNRFEIKFRQIYDTSIDKMKNDFPLIFPSKEENNQKYNFHVEAYEIMVKIFEKYENEEYEILKRYYDEKNLDKTQNNIEFDKLYETKQKEFEKKVKKLWHKYPLLFKKELEYERIMEELEEITKHLLKKTRKLEKQLEEKTGLEKQLEKLPYFTLHGNTLTKAIKQILINPTKHEILRGSAKFEVKTIGDIVVISHSTSNFEIKITLKQYSQLFKKSVMNGIKIFNFILQKLNEQNYNETIKFNLQELVDNGIYNNIKSAYRGLETVLKKLQSIEIEAIEKIGKKEIRCLRTPIISATETTFNICLINLPAPIRTEFSKYLTLLPKWSYHLTDKAYCLLDYICYQARQSSEQIKNKNKYSLTFEAIRIQLGLPNEKETLKHSEKIIKPILEIIEEIEIKQKQFNSTSIKITPVYINPNYENGIFYKNIKEFLASKIEIQLDDIFRDCMTKRAIEKEKKVKQLINRNEKALIMAKSRKIKNKD